MFTGTPIKTARLVLAGATFIFWADSFAFQVLNVGVFQGKPYHELVTADGLLHADVKAAARLSSGATLPFNLSAVKIVQEEVRAADSKFITDDFAHFDNEAFNEGNAFILKWRTAIVESAKAGDFVLAQQQLGWALHTLQDFYAHSTWVEKSGASPNPSLGTATFSISPSTTATCGLTSLLPSAPITSGYFTLSQAFGSIFATTNAYSPALLIRDRCVHGPGNKRNDADDGKGINKDSDERDLFPEASAAAAASTRLFVIGILSDLAGNDKAICGLLGQEARRECGGGYWQGSLTYTSCSTPGYYASGNPCAYVLFSVQGGGQYAGPIRLSFRTGTSDSAKIRLDHQFNVRLCSAPPATDIGATDTFVVPRDLSFVFFPETDSTNLVFTVTKRSPSAISGEFTGKFLYPNGPSDPVTGARPKATGTISGTWSASPRSQSFPKCVTNGARYCTSSGTSFNGFGGGVDTSCPWSSADQLGRIGEWQ